MATVMATRKNNKAVRILRFDWSIWSRGQIDLEKKKMAGGGEMEPNCSKILTDNN